MMRRGVFPRSRAFTLIELLCVISIIAILAGMILASLGSINEKGDAVKCTQNLRSIGAAVQLYVGAHDNEFPEVQTDPNNPTYPPPSEAKGMLETFAPFGLVQDSVKCPADVKNKKFNYFVKYGTSYEWAPYVDDELQSAPQIFTRRGQLTMPLSRIVVCFDVERVHGINGDYPSKKNYLYADGHIRDYTASAPRAKPKN